MGSERRYYVPPPVRRHQKPGQPSSLAQHFPDVKQPWAVWSSLPPVGRNGAVSELGCLHGQLYRQLHRQIERIACMEKHAGYFRFRPRISLSERCGQLWTSPLPYSDALDRRCGERTCRDWQISQSDGSCRHPIEPVRDRSRHFHFQPEHPKSRLSGICILYLF